MTMQARLHGGDVLRGRDALVVEAQPLLHLLLHALPKHRRRRILEAVDPALPQMLRSAHLQIR